MPTSKQRALRRAAERLDPAQGLDTIDASAGRITSALTLASALVGGFGLISAVELNDVGVGWALPAVLAAAVSTGCAVWATVPSASTLRPGDLSAVEWWFDHQIKRRVKLVRVAGISLALAVACASLPMIASAVDEPATKLAQSVSVYNGSVQAQVSVRNAPSNARVAAVVRSGGRRLAVSAAHVNADGAVEISLAPRLREAEDVEMVTTVRDGTRLVSRQVSAVTAVR